MQDPRTVRYGSAITSRFVFSRKFVALQLSNFCNTIPCVSRRGSSRRAARRDSDEVSAAGAKGARDADVALGVLAGAGLRRLPQPRSSR